MSENTKKVVLITGASSGIGEACAQHLFRQGYRVFGTSRHIKSFGIPTQERGNNSTYRLSSRSKWELDKPKNRFGFLEMLQMDVDNETSVTHGIDSILSKEGRLDVVVNNAGFGLIGAVEDTSIDEAKAQFETNFFGVVRVCRAALPVMRQQHYGYIVNISSMAGLIAVPFYGMYSASKFAIEGMTEALREEVYPYGIKVILIEPGNFKTPFTMNRRCTLLSNQNTTYTKNFKSVVSVMDSDEVNGPSPLPIAYLLERVINTPSPRIRYTVGPASEKIAVVLRKIMPERFFEWGLRKYYKLY